MSVLVIAEHDNAALGAATLNTIAAARELDEDVHVLVAGAGCAGAAEAAAKAAGVGKVRVADDDAYANQLAENLAALIAGIAGEYSHVLIAATKAGKNVLPRAAALLDVSPISDISGIESADTFVRPIYAGNAIATVRSSDALKLISVRATSFDPVAEEGGAATVESVDSTGDSGLSAFVGQDLTQSERPELTSARIVISGGRGMQSGDNFALLEEVADKLGGRGRRLAGRGRRRIRPQRLPGRADREGGGPRPLRRGGDLGCDPAPCRDEGEARSSSPSTRTRRRRSSRSRTTAWSRTCSRRCRS